MTKYRVIFEDPDYPDEPLQVLVPSDRWMKEAMEGNLPPISVYLDLKEAEQKAIDEGTHETFKHDEEKYMAQFNAERIGPLTEEQAIEYVIMKDIPRRVWGRIHNRPMFKIVTKEQIPTDRSFRNAWRMFK